MANLKQYTTDKKFKSSSTREPTSGPYINAVLNSGRLLPTTAATRFAYFNRLIIFFYDTGSNVPTIY